MEPQFEECPCPMCGGDAFEPFLRAGDSAFDFPGTFHVVRCRECALLYTRPRIAPNFVGRFYPANYDAHEAPKFGESRRHRDLWDQVKLFGGRQWLDVGCGSGGLLLRRRREGWNVFGVEPSAAAVRAGRTAGLEIMQGVIPGVDLGARRFDVITILGVIACVPDPRATLAALRHVLAPGGRLIVSEHNAGSAAASLFGPDWQGWDLPRHYAHFTPDTMRKLLEREGFEEVQVSGRRRTSRWRHSARRKARQGSVRWRLLASSRNLCSLASVVLGCGIRYDEIVVTATVK